VRGFKVHASVVDPLATPLVAQSIDVETAEYDGVISAPNMTGCTYTNKKPTQPCLCAVRSRQGLHGAFH
jgi:hypothetical protein